MICKFLAIFTVLLAVLAAAPLAPAQFQSQECQWPQLLHFNKYLPQGQLAGFYPSTGSQDDVTPPPAEPVHFTAQWEEGEGCLLAWPLEEPDCDTIWTSFVNELQDVGTVFMLYRTEDERQRQIQKLNAFGVPTTNIAWIQSNYDTHWTRDYGPQNIYGDSTGEWGLVDNFCIYGFNDNRVNDHLAENWPTNYYCTPIVCEGGNILTDGMGNLFCTNWMNFENQAIGFWLARRFGTPTGLNEQQMRQTFWDYLNVELCIFPTPPISPHLDMCAKLVNPETWIIGQWPADDPNTPVVDAIIAMLDTMIAPTGNPYTIYRLQQPPRLPNGAWDSYTNSYMQNGTILVPKWGYPEQDSAALAVFQQALPTYEVVGISCIPMSGWGGCIHCSTHEIASWDVMEAWAAAQDMTAFVPMPEPEAALTSVISPNPFNPSTTISYRLQTAGYVSLKVYNSAGRLVATLAEGRREAGEQQITFDGSSLPSGVYVYIITAGELRAGGKMVLLK